MRKRTYSKNPAAGSHVDRNVRQAYENCVTSRKSDWQQKNKHVTVKAGDFVKLAFEDPSRILNEVEHMWVQVLRTWDNEILGKLNNDPAVLTMYTCGDNIRFTRQDIEDLIPA